MLRVRLVRDESILEGGKLEILKYCQRRKQLTDVTLISGDKFYSVHKVLLASVSRAARNDYLSGRTSHTLLVVADVHPHDVENIICLLYDGEVSVPPSEVQGLFKVARMLGIDQFEPTTNVVMPEEILYKGGQSSSQPVQPCSHMRCNSTSWDLRGRTSPVLTVGGKENKTPSPAAPNRTCANQINCRGSVETLPSPINSSGQWTESSRSSDSIAGDSMCSLQNESSSLGQPEHLRNVSATSFIHGNTCCGVQSPAFSESVGVIEKERAWTENSFPREESLRMSLANVTNVTQSYEFLKSTTSVWTDELEQLNSCIFDRALSSTAFSIDSPTSSSLTAADIVDHVENLPSFIETPPGEHDKLYEGSFKSSEALELERARTPTLTRSLPRHSAGFESQILGGNLGSNLKSEVVDKAVGFEVRVRSTRGAKRKAVEAIEKILRWK